MAKKPRKFTITLHGTVPPGMTVAQARHAYWNGGFDGDSGRNYDRRKVDVDEYFPDGRQRRPMIIRLGKARLEA